MSEHIQENTEPDINLLDLLIALGQEKWTLIVVTFLAALAGVEPAVAAGALQASLPERTPMCAPPAATLLCCRAVQ